jgi:hypothetical protein
MNSAGVRAFHSITPEEHQERERIRDLSRFVALCQDVPVPLIISNPFQFLGIIVHSHHPTGRIQTKRPPLHRLEMNNLQVAN